MPTQRLDRSIRLLQLLDQQEPVSLSRIAAWLDCSQRTVHRDLQLLKDNGYDVQRTERGYLLNRNLDLPAPALNPSEILVLLVAAQATPLASDDTGKRLIQSTLHKIFATTDNSTKHNWLALTNACQIDPRAAALVRPDDAARMETVAIAISERLPIQCRTAGDQDPTSLGPLLVPESLIGQPEGWFVAGKDHHGGSVLSVTLSQIPATRSNAGSSTTVSEQLPAGNAMMAPHTLASRPKERTSETPRVGPDGPDNSEIA